MRGGPLPAEPVLELVPWFQSTYSPGLPRCSLNISSKYSFNIVSKYSLNRHAKYSLC